MATHCISKLKRSLYRYLRITPTHGIDEAVNVVDSIANAKTLYRELSKLCHPDLYENSDKYDLAVDLFRKLQDAKYDNKKLLAIKKSIMQLKE